MGDKNRLNVEEVLKDGQNLYLYQEKATMFIKDMQSLIEGSADELVIEYFPIDRCSENVRGYLGEIKKIIEKYPNAKDPKKTFKHVLNMIGICGVEDYFKGLEKISIV